MLDEGCTRTARRAGGDQIDRNREFRQIVGARSGARRSPPHLAASGEWIEYGFDRPGLLLRRGVQRPDPGARPDGLAAQLYVSEVFLQQLLEFGAAELAQVVFVVMTRAVGVDLPVGCGHQQDARCSQHPADLSEHGARVRYVFDRFETDDRFEALVRKGQAAGVGAQRVRHAARGEGLPVEIQRSHVGPTRAHQQAAVALAAAEVQHLQPLDDPRRERVAVAVVVG